VAPGVPSLDRYVAGSSPVHAADARVKLVVTLAFIVAVTSLPAGVWPAYGAMAAGVWVAVAVSRAGLLRLLRRSSLAIPFVLIAVPSMFTRPGEGVFDLGLGFATVTATDEGLAFVGSVVAKSWMSVTAAALLTATTPMPEVIRSLRSLGVPAVLVSIVAFMYRYVFVLVDEAQRLLRARAARSAGAGAGTGGTIAWRARVAGGMAGSLFLRTYERSERIYLAMLARGFDGEIRGRRERRLKALSAVRGAALVAACAAVAVSARVVL